MGLLPEHEYLRGVSHSLALAGRTHQDLPSVEVHRDRRRRGRRSRGTSLDGSAATRTRSRLALSRSSPNHTFRKRSTPEIRSSKESAATSWRSNRSASSNVSATRITRRIIQSKDSRWRWLLASLAPRAPCPSSSASSSGVRSSSRPRKSGMSAVPSFACVMKSPRRSAFFKLAIAAFGDRGRAVSGTRRCSRSSRCCCCPAQARTDRRRSR